MIFDDSIIVQQSTMYGGTLCTAGIVIIQQLDQLIAAYSHQLFFFRLGEATIKSKAAHHQTPILSLHYHPPTRTLTSIDEQGYAVLNTVNQQGEWKLASKKKLFQGYQLKEAKIINDKQGEIVIYGIELNGKLLRQSEGLLGKITESASKILYFSRQWVVVRLDDWRVAVIDAVTMHLKFQYCHTCEITSAEVYQSNLVLGDVRGKINLLKGFLQTGEVQLKQKLQWHVHEVSALKVQEAFLYSGGQEGVVVLWHLRENRKDFLPRIGSKIVNLLVNQSKIYCLLADNTIKSIDLNNDKAIVHYKTVISTGSELIHPSSLARAKDNLIRVSPLSDKIYMRSLPGRLQSIHLSGGLNTEYNIVSRNNISRLDKHLPNPHQITDVAFSHDFSQVATAIQGNNCRSLKFYIFDQQEFKLVSKVQNCHQGEAKISLLTMGDRFVSYSKSDSAIKVWKRMSHRKESLIQVEQHYWGCEYEISYKQKLPIYVSSRGERITAVYEGQFTIFNTKTKAIQASYLIHKKQQQILAIYQTDGSDCSNFLLIYAKSIELVNLKNKKTTTEVLLDLSKQTCGLDESRIYFNHKLQSLAALIEGADHQKIFIYHPHRKAELLQVQSNEYSSLTELFWVGQRLLAIDSQLLFHDLTHQQQLIHFGQSKEEQRINEMQEQMQEEETGLTSSYDLLYNKYLERQYRKDRATIEKNNQIISLTPSITASFQLFASQLFL